MLFTDVIRKKRDGGELSDEEIQFFVDGLSDNSLPVEQVAALAMAIYLNSMSFGEAGKLTLAMAASGTVIDWTQQKVWMDPLSTNIRPVASATRSAFCLPQSPPLVVVMCR